MYLLKRNLFLQEHVPNPPPLRGQHTRLISKIPVPCFCFIFQTTNKTMQILPGEGMNVDMVHVIGLARLLPSVRVAYSNCDTVCKYHDPSFHHFIHLSGTPRTGPARPVYTPSALQSIPHTRTVTG